MTWCKQESWMKTMLVFLVTALLAVLGCTEGRKAKAPVTGDLVSDSEAPDGLAVGDVIGGDVVLPDLLVSDTAGLSDTGGAGDSGDTGDNNGTDGVVEDATPEDGVVEDGQGADSLQVDDVLQADVGVLVPFAGCSENNPCTHPDAPLCLLLPSLDNEGVCVKKCTVGADDCPPWLECTPVNADQPDFAVCLEVLNKNQPCSNLDGQVCKDGLYCALKEGDEGAGICTTYCTVGETLCSNGYTCTVLYQDQPDWGACLPVDPLPTCSDGEQCSEAAVCVAVVPEVAVCAASCPDEGNQCGQAGNCISLPVPGAPDSTALACIALGKAGEICLPEKGLSCQDTLFCTDVKSPDGWNRCLAPCDAGSCQAGLLCVHDISYPEQGLCTPFAYAFPEPVHCNDLYPCPEPDTVCVSSGDDGLCLPTCDAGCPEHTTCMDGACMLAVPPHAPCNEAVGILCMEPAQCITDPGKSGSGWCAPPCTPGQNLCSLGTTCVETVLGPYCLQTADYGQLCSLEHGMACDPAQNLKCIAVSPDSGWGFCSPECSGPAVGDCPDLGDAYVLCNFKQSGIWYCAFSCFGVQSCPEGLECSQIGICMP